MHGDHTGGNANLGKAGVTIIARTQLRARLEKPNPGAGGAPATPAPAAALPLLTYDAPMTFHMNGEQVQLIPVPAAHTDGDTMVYFLTNDVIMTGDFYRSAGYPNIDRANGGSFSGMLAGLNKSSSSPGPQRRSFPATATSSTRPRWRSTATADGRSRQGRADGQEGKTEEQVLAAKPTADYDGKVPGVGTTGDRFLGRLYAELKAPRP